ncbi:MAG: hypothetical protein QOC59_1774 [Microbacteriaceae bacterium]|nr:hypothetical protein [Microbacteriaceae bacterium]
MAADWPGAGIRIDAPRVTLRPVDERHVGLLQAILPEDLELDPAVAVGPGDPRRARAQAFGRILQRDRDRFSTESWKLHLAVRAAGELVGMQTVEAERFASDHTVDSASWLAPTFRGDGLGTAMREAVLAFAFFGLGATTAVSSAWHDNAASLGVSRRLGYRFDHTSRLPRGDVDDELVHVRLTRTDWLASGLGRDVAISGVRPELFGGGGPTC